MLNKIRLIILSAIMITVVLASPVVTVRADGNLLRGFDVPALTPFGQNVLPSLYWPIGVAVDGHNLWYSEPCSCTSDIFLTSTTGTLLNTLHEVNQAGGLAWDRNHLWVGSFLNNPLTCTTGSTQCAFLTEVDVSTANPIKAVDLSNIFSAGQESGLISRLRRHRGSRA